MKVIDDVQRKLLHMPEMEEMKVKVNSSKDINVSSLVLSANASVKPQHRR